jgi:hypothetical protein
LGEGEGEGLGEGLREGLFGDGYTVIFLLFDRFFIDSLR